MIKDLEHNTSDLEDGNMKSKYLLALGILRGEFCECSKQTS
jgi:hypothetical protein